MSAPALLQPHSQGPTMELRGVCVLLGVLLLVHWSVQQNQPRRKPVKKGTASISDPSCFSLTRFLW